ncbi:MAG TPA: DinB family protein [Anaerolineaceae bacterium]|nr:DinB family protein [Anaerolineaceae bacterium]
MNAGDIQLLFNYNYWANARILRAASKLTREEWTQPARLSHGSIRGAMVHTMAAEYLWRMRFQEGVSLTAMPQEGEFPTFESLQKKWAAEEKAMRAYLASLSDADLNSKISYTNTKGVPFENVLWHLMAHVVNHGTQFRGEAAVGLTRLSHSPGDLDLIAYIREKGL